MKEHINIPVFIPHLGCPNLCVFCNQRYISGRTEFDINSVEREIESALSTKLPKQSAQIAFFGGSFTGIGDGLMTKLLDIAEKYVKRGEVESIRLSTRPDYINPHIIEILSEYTVKTVELGIQSMDDRVLVASKRGHRASDSIIAAKLLKDAEFEFVAQMMIGLPCSDINGETETAQMCCEMGADAARIYPTVVFRGSELAAMTENGEYKPLTTDEAVERTKSVLSVFYTHGVPCIRVGLCASENLSSEDTYVAGPNHPAIGELAINSLYLDKIREEAKKIKKNTPSADSLCIYIAHGRTSSAVGQRGINRDTVIREFGLKRLKFVERADISGFDIECKEMKSQKGEG